MIKTTPERERDGKLLLGIAGVFLVAGISLASVAAAQSWDYELWHTLSAFALLAGTAAVVLGAWATHLILTSPGAKWERPLHAAIGFVAGVLCWIVFGYPPLPIILFVAGLVYCLAMRVAPKPPFIFGLIMGGCFVPLALLGLCMFM